MVNISTITDLLNVVPLFLGELVAQFKFTVLLMPTGTLRITGLQFDTDLYSSEHSVTDPEIKVFLNFLFQF